MAGKKVWVTWLPGGDDAAVSPQDTLALLTRYGLEVSGAPWIDDLEKLAWSELGGTLLDPANADLWLIAGLESDFQAPEKRYGLSMVAAMALDARAADLPILCLGLDFAPRAAALPSLLRGAKLFDGREQGWGAKAVAAAFSAPAGHSEDFRLNVIGHSLIGQWLEVGPVAGEWPGVMLGTSGEGKITHHAVGPRGQLPEKAVLEYPLEGLEAELGGAKFVAWAVQNTLGPGDSYFVRLEGHPAKLILGHHPGADEAEVYVVELA